MDRVKPEIRPYFKALDGVRLLASLNIVLLHLWSSQSLGMLKDSPNLINAIKAPLFNASIFFILGGFIFYPKFEKSLSTHKTWAFVKSRLSKLYPLHFLSMILMLALVLHRSSVSYDLSVITKSIFAHASLLWAFAPSFALELNGPSWALTPFFIAYLTVKPLVTVISQEKREWALWFSLALCLVPSMVTSVQYANLKDAPGAYMVFHAMPLVRVVEFYFGMILSRLLSLRMSGHQKVNPWIRDLIIVLSLLLLWYTLRFQVNHGYYVSWTVHHVGRLVLYAVIIWHLAAGQGVISRILSMKPIAVVGRASFYPYLLHLPLLTSVYMVTRLFDYHNAFTKKWHLYLFLTVLYGLSTWYSERKKASLKACRTLTNTDPKSLLSTAPSKVNSSAE